MKKIISCVLLLFLLLFLLSSGCSVFYNRFTCDVDDVKLIQIVSLGEAVPDEYRHEYTVLCEIDDKEEFIERFLEIDQSSRIGTPLPLVQGYIVIRIEYNNGDYDLIHYSEHSTFPVDGYPGGRYVSYDKEQFQKLVQEYLSTAASAGD